MFVIVGTIVVIACVLGGYMWHGGDVTVLWQPSEVLIIGGAAVGAFLIGTPKSVLVATAKSMPLLIRGSRHTKKSYLELLSLLYSVFKLAKTKGDLALESHVERPDESPLFGKFPNFSKDHHTRDFLCDYLRLLTLGTNNAHELEAVIDEEIEQHHTELHSISSGIITMADGMPALGIVAAVLGVIITMGSITEPPEILGKLIGAALVGTFLGVLLSYGFVAPMGRNLEAVFNAETKYLQAIKAALLAHMQGYAPQISIEFARKILPSDIRPSFQEVEETVTNLPPD